ncbi:MAG: GDP-mannose 4,6-dehydratase, partial [Thermoanaerobaculia bacterium]
ARIARGLEQDVHLGTLEPRRDWGYALDTVEGMRAIVGAKKPDDFILATGETHSVGDFCEAAFEAVGLDYRKHVVIDPEYARPVDINETRGDARKALRELGWAPRTSFRELVKLMVDAENAVLDGRGEPSA